MAEVYLARDLLLDRPVALKVLFPEFSTDPSFVERFRREARAAANLNHPNIVSIYDWGEEGGTYFIVMEYVDGQDAAGGHPGRGPAAGPPGGRDRRRHRRRPPVRPRPRRRPPRREARQRDDHRPAGEGHRLRHRPGRRPGREPHPDRRGHGHRHLLLARAGPGPRRRRPQRRLLARRRPLRDGHRPAAVQGRQPGGHRLPARPRAAGPAQRDQPRRPPGLRGHHPQGHGQGHRRTATRRAEALRADLLRYASGQPVSVEPVRGRPGPRTGAAGRRPRPRRPRSPGSCPAPRAGPTAPAADGTRIVTAGEPGGRLRGAAPPAHRHLHRHPGRPAGDPGRAALPAQPGAGRRQRQRRDRHADRDRQDRGRGQRHPARRRPAGDQAGGRRRGQRGGQGHRPGPRPRRQGEEGLRGHDHGEPGGAVGHRPRRAGTQASTPPPTPSRTPGSRCKTVRRTDAAAAVDAVIDQDPKPGPGKRGATITLVVSNGPEQVRVPEVRGRPEGEAANLLGQAGFKTRTSTEQSADRGRGPGHPHRARRRHPPRQGRDRHPGRVQRRPGHDRRRPRPPCPPTDHRRRSSPSSPPTTVTTVAADDHHHRVAGPDRRSLRPPRRPGRGSSPAAAGRRW